MKEAEAEQLINMTLLKRGAKSGEFTMRHTDMASTIYSWSPYTDLFSLMYKVYQNAQQTVVWLGQADANATLAITYARTLDAESMIAEHKTTVMYAGYEEEYMQKKSHILDELARRPAVEALINACAEFLLRPYFTRVWCQQEGSLSTDPILFCGSEELPWNQLFALAWLFVPRSTMIWPDWFLASYPNERYAKLEPNLFFIRNVQEYRLRQAMIASNEDTSFRAFSLLHAVHDASRFRCFDPRDKIFAMRNIATDLALNDWAPKPDYATPWEDIYTELAARMATRQNHQLLDWSGVCQQGDQSGLPSWVVDWRTRPWTYYINHTAWSAGGKAFKPKAEPASKKKRGHLTKQLQSLGHPRKTLKYTLQVLVLMIDGISFLSGTIDGWTIRDDITRLRDDVLTLDKTCQEHLSTLPVPYIDGRLNLEAYNATLIANTTDQDILADTEYIARGATGWRAWLALGARMSTDQIPPYHEAIDSSDTFQYKQFCISRAGYFCLVPNIALPTDAVAIVKGIDLPVILRPVGDFYIYLGQCYIHGMMHFQAGELIDEFRCKFDMMEKKVVVHRREGEIRRNGRKADHGEYVRMLGTLAERKIELI
jgi:hypothetical protein